MKNSYITYSLLALMQGFFYNLCALEKLPRFMWREIKIVRQEINGTVTSPLIESAIPVSSAMQTYLTNYLRERAIQCADSVQLCVSNCCETSAVVLYNKQPRIIFGKSEPIGKDQTGTMFTLLQSDRTVQLPCSLLASCVYEAGKIEQHHYAKQLCIRVGLDVALCAGLYVAYKNIVPIAREYCGNVGGMLATLAVLQAQAYASLYSVQAFNNVYHRRCEQQAQHFVVDKIQDPEILHAAVKEYQRKLKNSLKSALQFADFSPQHERYVHHKALFGERPFTDENKKVVIHEAIAALKNPAAENAAVRTAVCELTQAWEGSEHLWSFKRAQVLCRALQKLQPTDCFADLD